MVLVQQYLTMSILTLVSGSLSFRINGTEQELEDKASLLEWEAPTWIQNKFPYYLSGFDYEDRPVVVIQFGKWDTLSLVTKSGDDLNLLTKHFDQLVERVKSRYFRENGTDLETLENEVALIITDYDGFSGKQYASRQNIEYLYRLNSKLETMAEHIAYWIVINATPFTHFTLNASKLSLAKVLERMEAYGTNKEKWIPVLLRRIPKDQLPPGYGGNKNYRPVGFHG